MPSVDIAKLKAKCSCIDNNLTDAEISSLIAPTLLVIAELTGWTNGSCSTPYKGVREEKIKYDFTHSKCHYHWLCSNWHKIELCSKLIDKSTIKVDVYVIDDSGETKYSIKPTNIQFISSANVPYIQFNLSEKVLDENNVEVNIPTYICNSCREINFIVTYEAGYDTLPDCVIDSICTIYNYLNLIKIGCSSTTAGSSCATLDKVGWNARLTDLQVGQIQYTFDYPTNQIQSSLDDISSIWLNNIHQIDNLICFKTLGIYG